MLSLEERLEIIRPSDKANKNLDMNGTMLSYPTHYPKDISRNILKEMFNTTFKSKSYELLKIEKCMIDCHYLDNFRKIMIPSSLKPCAGFQNSETYHADKIGIIIMKDDANIAKRPNEIITNEAMSPNAIIIKTDN